MRCSIHNHISFKFFPLSLFLAFFLSFYTIFILRLTNFFQLCTLENYMFWFVLHSFHIQWPSKRTNVKFTCNFSQALTFITLLSNIYGYIIYIILSLTLADYIKSTMKLVYFWSCWFWWRSHLPWNYIYKESFISNANHFCLDSLHWHKLKHTQYALWFYLYS